MKQLHTPRFAERAITLDTCFQVAKMDAAWKNFVKSGMRSQDVLDLFDYHDFHRNRTHIFQALREEIIQGHYKPRPPLVIKREKKLGVCRHLPIPFPHDALVLQTLVEEIAPKIQTAAPTTRAYYSRSHAPFKSEADIDHTFPYAWWELWPEFQQRIYNFTRVHPYIAITDIANYFDTVSLSQLRNIVAGISHFDECVLDLLFLLLQSFIWTPDYLPVGGHGLPQVQFDAPRLLAHSFLFEIDLYLNKETQGEFVRWMDDIDFGVDSVSRGKEILGGLDQILLTRGLRLNLGKTQILSSADAERYFLIYENQFLTTMTNLIVSAQKRGGNISRYTDAIRKRFAKFNKRPRYGRWDKVLKRYFSISIRTKDTFLQKQVPSILEGQPELRQGIFDYYRVLGPNRTRVNHAKNFFLSKHCADDASIFACSKLFVDWAIQPRSVFIPELVDLAKRTAGDSFINLISSIWILAKYGSDTDLVQAIRRHEDRWKHSNYTARQIAATLPRFRHMPHEHEYFVSVCQKHGLVDPIRIIHNLNELRINQPLNRADSSYILHGSGNISTYPLGKYLMASDILSCPSAPRQVRINLQSQLLQRIPDPLYRQNIQRIQI